MVASRAGWILLFGCLLSLVSPWWQALRAEDLAQLLERERTLVGGPPGDQQELAALRAAIAEAEFKTGNKHRAADYLYNSLLLDPHHPARWELLGDIVNFLSGASSDAVAQFAYEEALVREPGRAQVRLKLAASYLSSERFADAAAQFEKVLIANDDKPGVEHLKLLGVAYAMAGQLDRGRRFLEQRYAATGHEGYRATAGILAKVRAEAEP